MTDREFTDAAAIAAMPLALQLTMRPASVLAGAPQQVQLDIAQAAGLAYQAAEKLCEMRGQYWKKRAETPQLAAA